MKYKYIFFSVILLFFILPVSSCTKTSKPEDFQRSNTIYIPVISEEPLSINPLKSSNKVTGFLFERLLEVDGNGEIIPNLVETWSFSSDGILWTFKLRDNILWSDGEPLGVEDIIFTFNCLKDSKVCPAFFKSFEVIENIEEIDSLTFKIKLREPHAPLLSLLYGVYPLPEHMAGKSEYDFSLPPVSSGPFILKSFNPESSVYVTRNNNYWKEEKAKIENILFKIYKSRKEASRALFSGEIDIMEDIEPEDFIKLQDTREFTLYNYPGASTSSIGFNFKKEVFSDLLVRQAINYAIDREVIIEHLLHNQGETASGPLYPIMDKWYKKTVIDYDPQRAKKLLENAGWQMGEKGVMGKDGEYLYFKLTTYKGNPLRERSTTLIKEFLGEIGIFVETEFMERNEFIYSLYAGRLECWVIDTYGKVIDPDNLTYYYYFSGMFPEYGGHNYGFYSNEKVDEVLLQGRKEMVFSERIKYYHELQEILSKDLPSIFLYYKFDLIAINKRIDIPKGKGPALMKPYKDFCEWKILQEK